MSEVKFTPGPWKRVSDAQGTCGLMDPQQSGVAVAWFSNTFHPSNGYVGEKEHERGRPQREANVNLIAAAPDMYAALVDFIEYERLMDADRHTTGMLKYAGMREKIIKALAKARGEA
ncbi:hypothetical protein [Komagataeibacter europaeus]|uniref:hypothetical protein n=1 Tax=Komagataeibacter europaeus TaxID=33995 RepID=UPI0015FB63E5|nr:hypothetical protein [Komagataeibacter europaeus]